MHKSQLAIHNEVTNTDRLANVGKHYSMELVRDCVNELNNKTCQGIAMARKAIIMCELIPDVDGVWKIEQLSQELRDVVNANLSYFHGLNPAE